MNDTPTVVVAADAGWSPDNVKREGGRPPSPQAASGARPMVKTRILPSVNIPGYSPLVFNYERVKVKSGGRPSGEAKAALAEKAGKAYEE